MLLREKRTFDWALIQISSAVEDQHRMDTAFYNHQKIQNFLAIVKDRIGLGLGVFYYCWFWFVVLFGWFWVCLCFVWFGLVFFNVEKGLYSYKPRRRGVIHTR